MIVYDKFYKISGMSKRALEILKYNNVNDFLSVHNDLDEIAMNYQKDENSSFMQSLLNRAPEGINLSLKAKDGQILSVKAVPNEILMTNKDKIYELELTLNEGISKALANDTAKGQPILRMPLLWSNGMQRSGAKEQAVLDDKWFEQTREFLNLNSVDFASYLALLAKGVQSYLIALQNAIVARDKLSIKKDRHDTKRARDKSTSERPC